MLPLVVMLASCNSSISTSETRPTDAFKSTLSADWTEASTSTPVATVSVAIPGASLTVIPPNADQQVYIDPEGWYSVNFPSDIHASEKPNAFMGNGLFFETGYLPYMSKPINLCLWLANVESAPEQSALNWEPPCSVTTKAENNYIINYAIYENPRADPEHRFIYVKMGRPFPSISGYVEHTVYWLKTESETKPETSRLSPEEASFWEKPDTILSDAPIVEYDLPPEAQVGPTEKMLWDFVPEEAQPDWEAMRKIVPESSKEPPVEEQLKSLGYELKVTETQPTYRQQLFRDGRLLFDYVFNIPKVYKFSTDSGPITAFVVNTMDTRYNGYLDSFLIVNDAINKWDYSPADTANFAPILYQGELLWAKGTQNAGVEIRRSNRDILFTFRTYFSAHLAVDRFQAWNDHWILTAGDFVIQDGEILNQKLGFPEIFEWGVIDNKPLFLFRKGTRLGLSYDGKILLLPYEDIARGLCCGLAVNNPITFDDSMYFFGKRDGIWYYVKVKFR